MTPLRTAARDALQYWERRRFIYNGVLAAIVLSAFALGWPHSKTWFGPPASSAFIEAAIVANILYCAAYFAEFTIQFTPLGANLSRCRKAVFIVGVLLASMLALTIVVIISFGPMSN
jgi:hypothetical protein